MRCHRVILVVFAIVCLSTASHAEETTSDSPESFIKNWVTAFNKNEPAKLLAFYDRSEKTDVIISAGLSFQGYKAIEKAYRDDQENVRFSDSVAKKVQARTFGDTAIVAFEHLFKTRILADDSRWQVHIRTTSVLHREEKKWRIVHEHSSPIRGVGRMTRIKD